MDEKVQQILNLCNHMPIQVLAGLVDRGEITFEQLAYGGLFPYRQHELRTAINNAVVARMRLDNDAWNAAIANNSVESYRNYMNHFPNGVHRAEASQIITKLDDDMWQTATEAMNRATLETYKTFFPQGRHISDCQHELNDPLWLDALNSNTIEAFENYLQQCPGNHEARIAQRLETLYDERDWGIASGEATTQAYINYLDQHPTGAHAPQAQAFVDQARRREQAINALMMDRNALGAAEIKNMIQIGDLKEDDVVNIFGPEPTNAIISYTAPKQLPERIPPQKLQRGTTEVYFWGTPSSGKTCALGAILSSVKARGIFEPVPGCAGYDYMIQLSNIFEQYGVSTYPDSTSIGNIQEMVMDLHDEKGKPHRVTLIDLAGELFRTAYDKECGNLIDDVREQTLQTALSYLKDKHNEKMHFFVIEYGAHDKQWEQHSMLDYLVHMMSYLKKEKILRKSSTAVYVLVTKCDKIPCPPEQRPEMANSYVKEFYSTFWNTLELTCKEAGIKDLKTLAFSTGQCFAQNLCYYDPSDTNKVIDKFLLKIRSHGSFLDKLNK